MTLIATVFLISFSGSVIFVVSVCYITLGGELEKCYIVLRTVGGWSKT